MDAGNDRGARFEAPISTAGRELGELGDFGPSGFEERTALRDSPERRLLLAVLADALNVYERHGTARGGEAGRRALEVERWVASEAMETPFAFIRICEALEIDPAPIRQHVRRIRLARLAGPEPGPNVEERRGGRTR